MTSDSQSSVKDEARRTRRLQSRRVMVDVVVLLILSLAAVGSAFTTRVGRASICGDSLQYIAAAEALLDPDVTPHFEMRKPGYPLFLAGVKLAFGQLGWAAIVCNHLLMIFLPLAAYGLGTHLRSRLLGWTAAILTMVQLQSAPFPNWMMAEALYTFLLSVGVVLFVTGLLRSRAAFWLAAAGLTLGLAWLTKGAATAMIPVALIAIAVAHRRNPRRAALLYLACAAPVVGVVLLECSLNHVCAGRFRPSNGTDGSCMWAFRMRAFQGAGIPDSVDGDRLSDLLPERGRDQASVGNYQDQWVSRYRAIREEGWDDWDFDDLCRRVAIASIRPWRIPPRRRPADLASPATPGGGNGRFDSARIQPRRTSPASHPARDRRERDTPIRVQAPAPSGTGPIARTRGPHERRRAATRPVRRHRALVCRPLLEDQAYRHLGVGFLDPTGKPVAGVCLVVVPLATLEPGDVLCPCGHVRHRCGST